MAKGNKEKKPPERNWISFSVAMIILVSFLTYFSFESKHLPKLFSFVYFLILWILIFVSILGNALREIPDFELKNSLLKIKKIEIYESWYFLILIGLIFLFVVIIISLNCGEAWGIAVFGFLFGFLALWVRDILNKKREKS